MQLWGLEHEPDTLTWKRGDLSLSLLDEANPRQHCLREAWRAATWRERCQRGNRREAHIARAVGAEWQAAPSDAIRKLAD
eukprot:13931446-Alexandrium_andersonii.AAC.1